MENISVKMNETGMEPQMLLFWACWCPGIISHFDICHYKGEQMWIQYK